ncbi:phosphatidylinositol 4-phosphate 3-kinase C2 domain-containing subunit beta-like isoform X2 [Dreissena polymorpha]|uniref:phosphatidylinositol 4-phosphate 3-kinase C2 domain-containing subunit beta-like isoform X2 n=1 Tax=Dreissena polymorpha TaxID=45954 RepID=UPI002264403D|nr:phosphatidylinositol 4-phosphate 3-kinase C2 domain-containing subunit beta-like isoform X2 [Dreissena polymorpha]
MSGGGKIPPPIPPRPGQGMQYVGGFVGYSVPPQSYQSSPWTSNGNQASLSVSRPPSINLGNQAGSSLISLSSPEGKTSPRAPATSGYFSDLHDLDFSLVGTQTTSQLSSSTQSTTTTKVNIYPDISAAFSEIKSPSPQPSAIMGQPTNRNTRPVFNPHRSSLPMSYGWDTSLTQLATTGLGGISPSVPTMPLNNHLPFQQPQVQTPLAGCNLGGQFVPQNTNFYRGTSLQTGSGTNLSNMAVGFPMPHADFSSSNNTRKSNTLPAVNKAPISDTQKSESSVHFGDFNLVPNVDFPWTEADAFFDQQEQSGPSSSDTFVKGHKRQSSDLIQLGFEGVMTSEEKEYFSLEYFDPLHRKGRSVSVSTPAMTSSHYFFAKPPEESELISKDRGNWVTFDEGGAEIGRSGDESDVVVETLFVPNEPADTSTVTERSTHERLRKKLYIDDESDCFCQMVAELRDEFKSTDESTNLGFIVAPMCEKKEQGSMTVKITVHSVFAVQPICFTSDVHSVVEHVINQILHGYLSASMPRHMVLSLKTSDFILKVNDRSEYLLNEFPLSKYRYTHDCLKMDRDLCFRIMRRQDVALPFLRTIEDDNQQLYFPQDHVRDTDVTRDGLEIVMETFYKEVERITDLVLKPDIVLKDETDRVQFQQLSQSVKAVCNILSKIETLDILKSLTKVESLINQMKGSLFGRSSTAEHSDGGYATLQRGSMKMSHVPQLEEALESLVNSVKQLVRIYCQAFHTDFHLGTKIDQPWDLRYKLPVCEYPQDVTGSNESVIVQICTIHRIQPDWSTRFDEYKMECSLFHGTIQLCPAASSTCATINNSGLVPIIVWDEWLTYDIQLCMLPRETRLCITLVGVKTTQTGSSGEPQQESTPLGGVTIQVFNKRGYMLQGSQLVPLQMNCAADPVTPYCSTLQPDSALLQFNLPDFGKQINFSEPLRMNDSDNMKKTMKDLAPEIQEEIHEVMKIDCVATCTADQLEVLWIYRYHLREYPSLLPWILQAAHGWDWAMLPEIYSLLKHWSVLQPMQALELLLPQYPDVRVRAFAVDCLRKMPTDDLIDFIPQLIQALKYESYHSSPLARLLLEQSCRSVRFAHQFFWLLKGATQDRLYKRRYELMFVALVSVAGEALYQEFKKQEEIIKVLTTTAEKVQQAKGGEKENFLRKNLDVLVEIFKEKHHVLLPHNPGYEVSGIDMNSCSFFNSNAVPLKLVFRNCTENVGNVYAMFKVGDDLRQDMMTMQIIRIMDRLWLKEGLDLKMVTFSCLPTGPKRGFIEIITESETLRKIQVSSGVTGSFKDRPIKDWLQKHNPTELEYKIAVENFTCSCAGYCVATYVLGVCDRHNDNIMLKETGHLFHIDFNKILGDAQMFGNIKRDRVKFVLTSDMAYVINDGDRQSDRFQHFIDMCVQAFNILRKNANLFINLFSLMLRSGIPGITEKGVQFIQQALLPGCTDTQAQSMFTRMIQESLSSKSTQLNFFIHNLAQMKFSSHSEGALLSFVPKVYNQQVDGRIRSVEVFGIQKRYQPEKHYIYSLQVERENQKFPTFIFRIYSEFVEFRNKMAAMFPLINWPPLQGRVLLGRSHVKAVAENRRAEIERFLQGLMASSPEIAHCDVVYTFFHPLLRDEQGPRRERLIMPKLRERKGSHGKLSPKWSGSNSLSSPENPFHHQSRQGQVKLSLEYVKGSLQIMVIHAKDLGTNLSELPSPYVKTYLLPDPEKQTKRKTKSIKDTTHPTYNELIEYKIPMEQLRCKRLQVTIWDQAMLGENNILGAVNINFRDLDLSQGVTKWYELGPLQMAD